MPPINFALVTISSERVGEPTTGLWCRRCNLPSALAIGLALLLMPVGADVTQCDPVDLLVTMHICEECGEMFELPDVPVLVGSRDG